jgi:hypothetical protein
MNFLGIVNVVIVVIGVVAVVIVAVDVGTAFYKKCSFFLVCVKSSYLTLTLDFYRKKISAI